MVPRRKRALMSLCHDATQNTGIDGSRLQLTISLPALGNACACVIRGKPSRLVFVNMSQKPAYRKSASIDATRRFKRVQVACRQRDGKKMHNNLSDDDGMSTSFFFFSFVSLSIGF